MPDVFLSYSREDAAIARRFAEGFEREGLTVWWDATLKSGEAYDQVTEKALNDAKAVVVLWSTHSVASRWVRAEATEADRKGTLVPVMIEPCKRPIMFELTHTADLSGWNGDARDPAWRAFVADVQRYVGRSADDRGPSSTSSEARRPMTSAAWHRRPAARAMLFALPVLLVAALAFVFLRERSPSPEKAAPVATTATLAARTAAASVAVVPFANLTGQTDKEYFSDGMAEELINALAKVPGLNVASRTSSFAYKGKTSDVRQIARDLGVATIIEGSVRSAGDRVRVTAQLTSADSGYQLWSESFDRRFDDLFALQDELARQIVTAFRRTVGTQVAEFESKGPPTQDLQAYDLYLKGVASTQRDSDAAVREGASLFEQAVTRDPQFARAWAALAYTHGLLPGSVAEVERVAQRAVELDPGGTGALSLATANARRGKYVEAEASYASFTAKNEPTAHSGRALATLWPTGHLREALRETDEARRLWPANAAGANLQAMVAIATGDLALGARRLQEAVVLGVDPAARRVLQTQADIALSAGRYDEAGTLMVRVIPDRLRAFGSDEVVRLVYAGLKDPAKRDAAVVALQRLVTRLNAEEWVVKVWAMGWFSQLGALDRAYDVGRQLQEQFAVERTANGWSWLWSPNLQAFRRDGRFQPFVTRLNMMPYWAKYGPPDACTLTGDLLTCN